MSAKDHDIDALLRQNVGRQLAEFDWLGLRRNIAGRVASAGVQRRPRVTHLAWTAAAAGITVAAGIIVFAVTTARQPKPGEATVVMMETTGPVGTAQVVLADAQPPARCEVRIIPSDKPRRENRTRASWCIVAGQKPAVADIRNGRDARDILCLF